LTSKEDNAREEPSHCMEMRHCIQEKCFLSVSLGDAKGQREWLGGGRELSKSYATQLGKTVCSRGAL
jgi:hypothetical protein